MNTNMLTSEKVAVVATIDPDVYSAAAYDSDYVDMSKFESIQAVGMVGTMASSSTVIFKLQSATAATGGTDITGKTATTLTQAGSDSDKQVVINLRGDELTEGHRYVKMVMTVAAADSDAGGIILGFNPKNAPASDHDLASVDEILE